MDARFELNSMVVKQRPGVNANGKLADQMVVTYKVGENGPFTDTYDAASYTDAQGMEGVRKRVQQVKALFSATY
jgi:hypothetical protein